MMQMIDRSLLAELCAEATASPRGRKNRNFHTSDDASAHRLLIAMQPGSYVVPHCHLDPRKAETLVCVQGRLGLVVFGERGVVQQAIVLEPSGHALGVDIPPGSVHSVVALVADTVFLEAKAGPYCPLSESEMASWAPREGEAGVADYELQLRRLF